MILFFFFFFQAEDGIRDLIVTGVQTVLFRSQQGPQEAGEQKAIRSSGEHEVPQSWACRGWRARQRSGRNSRQTQRLLCRGRRRRRLYDPGWRPLVETNLRERTDSLDWRDCPGALESQPCLDWNRRVESQE